MIKQSLLLLTIMLFTTCDTTGQDPDLKSFIKQLRAGRDILIENKTLSEEFDFTRIMPSNPVSEVMQQTRYNASVTFKNCVFEREVRAYATDDKGMKYSTMFQGNLSFLGCTFKEPVTFRACSILGKTVFSGSLFEKTANFEECSFSQQAWFNRCIFHGELRFQNAFFMQQAGFLDAASDVGSSFQGTTFNATAQFSNTRFFGYTDFSLVNWNGDCFFNYAEIRGRSVFSSADFKQHATFISVIFEQSEIMNCSFFGKTDFSKSSATKQMKHGQNYFLHNPPDLSMFENDKTNVEE
ncbi:MAG: pentapeptide repeat-containing protein [Bacteroidales bacterium]|nr:pentapeptide repeat-containing protein [Bacteroidales bacterium]